MLRKIMEAAAAAVRFATWLLACAAAILRGDPPPPRPVGEEQADVLEDAVADVPPPSPDAAALLAKASDRQNRVTRVLVAAHQIASGRELDFGALDLEPRNATWLAALTREEAEAVSLARTHEIANAMAGRPDAIEGVLTCHPAAIRERHVERARAARDRARLADAANPWAAYDAVTDAPRPSVH